MIKNLYCFWTGSEQINAYRQSGLDSLTQNSGLNVILVTKNNLSCYIQKNAPLHPAYEFLSSIHKADYLRTYFMHFHGGGYADIKINNMSWLPALELLYSGDNYIEGYPEKPQWVIGDPRKRKLQFFKEVYMALNYKKLVGNCAYICKPKTPFTEYWLSLANKTLDHHLKNLTIHPAAHTRDYLGRKNENNKKSKYPLKWNELLGINFHKSCIRYNKNIGKSLPIPDFENHKP